MKRPAWCGDCQEFQPVALDSLGFWECQTCGCPTECGECGQTMTDDHECGEEAWNAAHQDLLILNETDRVKVRELIAGIAGGDFNAADGLIGSLRRNGFEIVSATAMVATPEAAAAIAKRGNTTYRCQVQQAGSGTCTWPTCGCGDA
jgi:hypothetical protein